MMAYTLKSFWHGGPEQSGTFQTRAEAADWAKGLMGTGLIFSNWSGGTAVLVSGSGQSLQIRVLEERAPSLTMALGELQ